MRGQRYPIGQSTVLRLGGCQRFGSESIKSNFATHNGSIDLCSPKHCRTDVLLVQNVSIEQCEISPVTDFDTACVVFLEF